MAAASVPFKMATARGAPPSRIGSVSARWTGTSNPWMRSHQRSAPPPKEKNDRKNELAAKAMERPKTI